MKKIRIIARAELNNLFNSPVAWLLLIIFLVQCSVTFGGSAQIYLYLSQYNKLNPGDLRPATYFIFSMKSLGMFSQIVDKLYLYLPLLTMGLMSREYNSGTIRLLYSSPVKTSQIVLGKFLAMVVYSLLLLAVLVVFAITAMCIVPHADAGLILSALLGFFLLLCAYSAIGLFMSCLTSYQVVAALSTLAFFAALHYLGSIWQGIDFVRDLTYFLSLGDRTKSMFEGMITSRDVLYFIIITVLFLLFSLFRLEADQQYRPLWVRIARYAGAVVIASGLTYFSSNPSLVSYLDATAQKKNTVSTSMQALLKSTGNEPLEITAYVNLLDNHYSLCSPQARHSYLNFWEPYVRYKPGIKFNYVYYYDTTSYTKETVSRFFKGKTLRQVAEEYAKLNSIGLGRFLKPEQAQKMPGLHDENGQFVMQLKYKGRTSFLRIFNDQLIWPSEDQIGSKLKRLIQPDVVPKIGFLRGDLERSTDPNASGDREYSNITTNKSVRPSLANYGFDITTINSGQDIPADLAALVIADPKVAFSAETMSRLQKYVVKGGNLLVTGEPGKQNVLNPLLQPMGVQMQNGILVQQNEGEVPDAVTPVLMETAGNMSNGAARSYNSRQPITMPGAAALKYGAAGSGSSGAFNIQPLLALSGGDSWLKMGKLVNDSAAVKFNAPDGDQRAKYFVPAVALTRTVNGQQQRIAVTGDADFMGNATLQLHPGNISFCIGLFKWISNGKLPVEPSYLEAKDLQAPTEGQLSTVTVLFTWIVPAMLLIAGTVLLIRRKRK
jgi:ABC-2 type transport system permease protein